jgi:FlaA1/EpsC-like NDP-sugar epimerase
VLCEEIARFRPAQLVLLDQSEYSLYCADELFARRFAHVPRVSLVADVRRQARMEQIFEQYRPGVVFHAAAYKHVPLLETQNAWEALRNNVQGTEATARAAMRTGVDRFVLVSTDKAVNPVSVMGVSKRMAEMVCQSLQQETSRPCFEIVRFGNVVGSAGSVLPHFEGQLCRGESLTVTHPDMRRYFMSVNEAARLLLQAATMGLGGEVFVMDMGEPVRMLDVARDMLRLAGVSRPDDRIEFIGLRPGERLFEELLAPGECTRSSEHPGLFIARARPVPQGWLKSVAHVIADDREPDGWRGRLVEWVPEYCPQD